MPTMDKSIQGKDESISAADALYSDVMKEIVEQRRKAEEDLFKRRKKIEELISDYQKNSQQTLLQLKELAELDLLEEQYEKEISFLKKLIDAEKKGLKLTQKDKDALRKKELKEKEKEEKEALKKYKKELREATAIDNNDQIKDGFKKIFSKDGDTLLGFKDVFKGIGKNFKNDLAAVGDQMGDALKHATAETLKAGVESVNTAMTTLSGVYSTIKARLLDSGESFKDINDIMRLQLAASPFIKYTDMLAKVDDLVDKGVAYNVELRAFLASISDKIATTFDAFDSNLLRIIRIQLEDSTKYRLGMEARLTEFLNRNYLDTSYLSGGHDSVTEALTASIVQLGTSKGAEYEYQIQKWFGSLSALGVGDSTLTGLASALNAAATGDLDSLNGSPFMNLIVMAANRAGISYADILNQGLNAESVNFLIQSIVTYWATIANETNQVVKNQYSKLFGLDMTDMTAIKNITLKDLNTIFGELLSYKGMGTKLNELLGKIAGRMHPSELLANVWDNFVTGIGLNIASNPVTATTWLINDFIKKATGGINIPSIGTLFAGTGLSNLDLEADVNSLIQLTMVGASTLGLVGKVIKGLGGQGGLNLSFWGADQYTRHGSGLSAPVTGVTASTSQTTFIGNSSSSDIYSQTLNKAYDDAGVNEIKSQTLDAAEKQVELMDNIEKNVKLILDLLESVSTGNAIRVKVEDYGLTSSFGV